MLCDGYLWLTTVTIEIEPSVALGSTGFYQCFLFFLLYLKREEVAIVNLVSVTRDWVSKSVCFAILSGFEVWIFLFAGSEF